jgi:hypothetical protein
VVFDAVITQHYAGDNTAYTGIGKQGICAIANDQ